MDGTDVLHSCGSWERSALKKEGALSGGLDLKT